MNGEDPWRPFHEVAEKPWELVHAWKERSGGKVVGHLLPDVPEELVYAAGLLPVAVQGAGVQVSRAQASIPGYTCSHAMGAVELKLRGELALLDGMIIPYVCDTTRNLFHIWNHCFPDMVNEFLRLPKRIDHPEARIYLNAEFRRILESMEKLSGHRVSAEELHAALELYNRSRARLRAAYARHQENPSVWTGERVQMILASVQRVPREDHLAWMDRLPWDEAPPADAPQRVPLYVKGKVWDPPGITALLDRLGFVIVRDEIVTGFRSIEQDADLSLDPLDALAQRLVLTTPYTGYHQEPATIVESFANRVQESRAAGVLFLNPKFCEAAAFDTPDMQSALQALNIPSLILETSARGISLEQIHVRLEAFREMIGGDLP